MDNSGNGRGDNNSDFFDFKSLINGLLFNKPEFGAKNEKPANDLEAELAGPADEEDFEADEETEKKIRELKAISEGIDKRLVTHREFPGDKKYKIDYRRELNPQQLAAVLTISQPLLVIAGAGSGKTRVITYKVSYLIERGIEPGQILLLTFTRKAANEMLNRVQKILADKSIGNVLGGTFHSFANNILRKYTNITGIPANFTIIDTEDQSDIISLLKSELNISGKKGQKHFPKSARVQTIISRAKNLELTIEETIRKYFNENIPHIKDIELLAQALAAYKNASNLFDYDDLLSVLRDKLRENKLFLSAVQRQVKYILVDEYQDTNNVQREITELLAGNSGRITVVGDDAQSIYSFRGANFENILRFPQSFPDCAVVKIEENYRSEQGILDFTNDIISNARIGFKKKLFSSRYFGRKPLIRRFADSSAEAEYIVDKVMEIRENDLSYSDFAVLTRAAWQSDYVQAELIKRAIPFVVVGGIKFSERRHVKDIISFLKIVLNPLDAVAWHRVLKLVEGVGDVRAREVIGVIHSRGGRIDMSSFSGRKHYAGLAEIERLFGDLALPEQLPADLIGRINTWYQPVLEQLEDDFEARKADLEIFSEIASKYSDLEKFLSDFTLEPPSNRYQDKTVPLTDTDEKPLVVSTIHSAKGLEWHTVFIPFALDGIIPSARSLGTLQEVEEERRLFYVAASRAKENLFITMPSYVSSWDAVFTKPSRFLKEVAKEHYEVEK